MSDRRSVRDGIGATRVRVLLLIKGLGRGGAEQLVVNSVDHGDASRFDYHVAYLLPWKDAFVPQLEALGVPVWCLDGGTGVGWVARLRDLIRDQRIDIVHVHSPYVAAMLRMSTIGRGTIVITTEHNVWDRYHPATYWANAVTFPRNRHVFAVSEEVGRSIRYPAVARFLRRPPIETLHHGIDLEQVHDAPPPVGVREELGLRPTDVVVGTVANFKPHKGHEYLLEVARLVGAARDDVRFVMVGGGPLGSRIEAEARRLGVEDRIVLTGFREDALRLMQVFDVYAMSSIHEGLSLTMLEAMALGCPVVATRVGGVEAVVEDGVSGFVVEPADTASQAERILRLAEDASLRRTFGVAARRRAASFDVRNAVARIEQVYLDLYTEARR